MGQYWRLVNLSRGRYVNPVGSGVKLGEMSHPAFLRRLQTCLRTPGGAWGGHRVLLTGDYDDDSRGRVADYLAANGLAVTPGADRMI